MPESAKTVSSLRKFRKLHRLFGLILATFLFISAVTGLLLAWKKNVDWIQPPTSKGETKSLNNWKSLPELELLATERIKKDFPNLKSHELDRIDIRPNKGMAKMLFTEKNMEVQIDGVSGEILSVAKRNSDWIEALHDGSIISDGFKLGSMNFLGLGLILLLSSGVWLWLGPRKIRLRRRRRT
ncbi:MAG: DNA mismatch repair protein [Saprospiraceae bacterium]|nr:DNA mismatch repair protein [Saprospiraceae bacterium]